MQVSEKDWNDYIKLLGDTRRAAEQQMQDYLDQSSAELAEKFGKVAEVPQWVAYRLEERNGKVTKVPVNPKNGFNAMTNKPSTWGTLAQAQEALTRFDADGVGFVLANGYFGIDLDHVIDPETGTIAEYALDIINRMGSYTEISPSGRGIHIIAKGEPDFKLNKNASIEMYYPTWREDGTIARGRYFTVTGNSFGPVRPIATRTEAAQSVWLTYIQGKPELPQGVIPVGSGTVNQAYALATKYGEASAALSCEMYDAMAAAQGVNVPPALPAPTATYEETARAVNGTLINRRSTVPATVGRLVKQAGADTMLKNAIRDGAEFAWVPHGDTCAFCITLASRGWQPASKKALKGGHAEHIHSNCDCEYAIRFDSRTQIAGYDPDRYLQQYQDADGRKWQDKVNAMRREQYAENADAINAQKRAAYERRKALKDS